MIARVSGPRPFLCKHGGGPLYIVPLQVLFGTPSVDDIPLSIGTAIHVYKNKTVEVTPDLFVLILVNNGEVSCG